MCASGRGVMRVRVLKSPPKIGQIRTPLSPHKQPGPVSTFIFCIV